MNTEEARVLFQEILDKEPLDVLVTDDAELSDFTGSGKNGLDVAHYASYASYCEAWDAWVLAAIASRFGRAPTRTKIPLIRLIHTLGQPLPRLN